MAFMNFEQVLKALLSACEQRHIRYAMIGGFALGVLGIPRATADVDCLVHRDDLDRFDEAMRTLGYQRSIRTENASHYRHPERAWGALDALHAFRTYSVGMLDRAKLYPIFDGAAQIRVLNPEDVIGLKVQALANNPLRRAQDTADIQTLADRYRDTLNWTRIQEYYALFDLQEEGRCLQKDFGHAG